MIKIELKSCIRHNQVGYWNVFILFALITAIKHATRAKCDNELQDGWVWYQTIYSADSPGQGIIDLAKWM